MRMVIDRRDGDRAVLRADDGQELTVAVAELPKGVSDGSVLTVSLRTDVAATEDRTAQAREILNEILGTDA